MTKVAVVTWGISHFEVPLYKLLHDMEGVTSRVFYILPADRNAKYDQDYKRGIDWGEEMLGGYDAQQCSNTREIHRRLRRWRPDVVIVYGYNWPGVMGLLFRLRLRGVPLVFRGTLNYYPDPRTGRKQIIAGKIVRPWIFRSFKAFHTAGPYYVRKLTSEGVDESRMFTVPYSIDTEYFLEQAREGRQEQRGCALRNELGWAQDDLVMMYIAQFSWFKNPNLAISVLAACLQENPRAKLLMVGDGALRDELRQRVADTGLEDAVHFTGFVPSKKTARYYLASDICLFTSRYETWGRALNEAMLCGAACIISEVFPPSEYMVKNTISGYVVRDPAPEADKLKGRVVIEPPVEAYVECIRDWVSKTDKERQQMCHNALEAAREMSYEAHLGDLRASLEHAMSH